MTASDCVLNGWYFDGTTPTAHDASLEVDDQNATLEYGEIRRKYAINTLRVSPRTGQADRFIEFADGDQYQCNDSENLEKLPQTFGGESVISWLEHHTYMVIVSIIFLLAFMFAGYRLGIPAIAEVVTQRIPIQTEISLGNWAIE